MFRIQNSAILLLARCQLYNANDFSDEPDFNIAYNTFYIANQNTFLGGGLNSMSAL